MPFDADLVLHDGTAITADKTPTSTTRVSGSICIDLGEGQANYGSGAKHLAAVLIDPDGLTDTNDSVVVSVEACSTVDGTYVEIARFQEMTGSGFSAATTQVIAFAVDPDYRYVRAKINITDNAGADFTEVLYVFLSPYAYHKL